MAMQNNKPRKVMAPRRMMGMSGEKAKDFGKTTKKLLHYLDKFKWPMIIGCLLAIGSTVFNIIGPKILGGATTEIFEGLMAKITGLGGIDFDKITYIILWTLGIYLFGAICNWLQGLLMATISQKIAFRLRAQISEKINRLPFKYFESNQTGDILSRITNDVDTLGSNLNQTMTQCITSVATVIGIIVMMLSISPIMTLVTALMIPLDIFFMALIIKKSQKYFKGQQKYLGKVNGQVEEVFGGQNVIKAFNRETKAAEEFDENNEELYQSAFKSQFLSGLLNPLLNFVSNLGYVGVVITGAIFASNGIITVGDIQAFIQYVKNLTQPIQQLGQISNQIQSMMAAAERVFEFLEEEEEIDPVDTKKEEEEAGKEAQGETVNLNQSDVKGKVDFDHVRFGYKPDKIVIHDWSANIEKGQTVAIVGPTGAGKTTMVKLLMRFYEVNEGAISVDDKNITSFTRHDLRRGFGMVLQDTWLFKGTIMENIRYGKLDATDEEVIGAAKLAHADHFIKSLPGGYDMELNEELDNISQGQKQLLTIARALLANRPILILDEATSSVDTRTELLIQKGMDKLMEGRTNFVIAHRLSTIRNADVILVMDNGDIIEQGTHEDLLKAGGFYAELYNSQFKK